MDSDWLRVFDGYEYDWAMRGEPATEAQIDTIARCADYSLPRDYVAFMNQQNGGSLWYREIWFIHLWRAQDVCSWSRNYGFTPDSMVDALAFGSDGQDSALVFDMRSAPLDANYPIVAVNFMAIGWDEAHLIAPHFRSLLLLQRELLAPNDE
jgi:hypothetical protein